MPTVFESHITSLSILRPDGNSAITFDNGRFVAASEADVEQLRAHKRFVREVGVSAVLGVSRASETVAVVPKAGSVDLAAFPYERRTYQRGNEPFVVLHLSQNLSAVVTDAALIATAVNQAFPAPLKVSLRFVCAGGARIVGDDPRASVNEVALTPKARLEALRSAHVLVHGPDAGDGFDSEAIAAGTPVVPIPATGADALAALLSAAEDRYGKAAAEAAKAEKRLRAAQR
jgi:hypothetical protein